MKEITLSTRLTREEYMAFAAKRHTPSVWSFLFGALLCVAGAVSLMIGQIAMQMPLLLCFGGVLLLLLEPMILPLWRKGRAARQYDASDLLKNAMSLTLSEQTLTVRSSALSGALPLDARTATVVTDDVIALGFGRELTVCIPVRALTEEELVTVRAILHVS